MINKIKKFIAVTMASLALMAPGLALTVPALGGAASAASISENLCTGSNDAGQNAAQNCSNAGSGGNVDSTITKIAKNITKWFSIIVGAVSIIMIIYGGFRYITSGGDSGRVSSAKNTLIYAIIGLIIVALAQLIVSFVVNQSSNVTTGPGL